MDPTSPSRPKLASWAVLLPLWDRYARESRRPLAALLFLLPWVVSYELWALGAARAPGPGRELLAHSVIHGLLSWFGLVGFWVPPAVLLTALLVWHVRLRHPWRVTGWVLPVMLIESAVLAVPLLLVAGLFSPPRPLDDGSLRVRDQLLSALGAGIYEELVFRLLLVAGLLALLARLRWLQRRPARWVAVALAALIFAACHFKPIGWDAPDGRLFVFLIAAGGYLGAVFLRRGLGVTAGAHAAYNVAVAWFVAG